MARATASKTTKPALARRPSGLDAASKRGRILEAASAIFAREGIEGASLRAIAAAAGYTPAALYFHFADKETIYAALLSASLDRLGAAIAAAARKAKDDAARFRAAALAFFDYYDAAPRELDLGFYLLRGGMKPQGLGPAYDRALNAALLAALAPIADAARALGASPKAARLALADIFAHASGLLLLGHTGRIRLFDAAPRDLMRRHVDTQLAILTEKKS